MVACASDGKMLPLSSSQLPTALSKHGSVLSPILFSIYIDSLIERLLKNKEGCWVGNKFFGCIVYADGVELFVPCDRGLHSVYVKCLQ